MLSRVALKQGRAVFAKQPIRTLASVSPVSSKYTDPVTHISTLSNGLTVASESNPHAQTATVGVWVDAGSRVDGKNASGSAHFLEHMAFKGTTTRDQRSLELEVENMGAHLNAYTSREQTVYYAKAFKKDVPAAVGIISDILQNSKLEKSAIERERDVILREQEEVDKQLEEVVFDHLHAVAFAQQPLGNTILGPKEHINSIQQSDLKSYIQNNYTADKMVLVGAGAVDHEELCKLAEKHFAALPQGSAVGLGKSVGPKPEFLGSEVRIRDDASSTCNFAIAFEGCSWSSPDYFPLLVISSILGNFDRSLGGGDHLSSQLSHIVSSNNLANSYMSFSTSYSQTGLIGTYFVSESYDRLDDLCHFYLKQVQRLATSPTQVEVERAKSQLKSSLLLSLDSSTAIAEDIGRQLVTTGKRYTPREIERSIDAITAEQIREVAYRYTWDKDICISAVGRVEGLLDYSRIRADTASMIY